MLGPPLGPSIADPNLEFWRRPQPSCGGFFLLMCALKSLLSSVDYLRTSQK